MKIRKINIVLALTLVVVGLIVPEITADAKVHDSVTWDVTYDGSQLESNYDVSSLEAKENILKVMPGDTITYEATYHNNSGASADFYLNTDIIDSLEDGNDASGGAYTFELSYKLGGAETYIYKDDTVAGLHQVKDKIEKDLADEDKTFFKVGTLSNGDEGVVVLKVILDGNTQDSSYMKAVANINLEFGVEKTPAPKTVTGTSSTNVVNTTNTKRVVYTVPGGSEIVAINDPTIPLAGGGNPVTGDEILPVVICIIGLVFGILLIFSYFAMERKEERR
ncbi:MAG: hypothetical protein IKW81_12755 [Pseudobutyrivibrio sp.]|nr:hypothetical protein [Pseudobutyrivibrio sp.]